MLKLQAVVAAGGLGQRLKLGRPKSSLEFEQRSLLYWTVECVKEAGFTTVDVFVDDLLWIETFKEQIASFSGVRVVHDAGYSSTFLLFKENCAARSRCLFTYGHAPRPAGHYLELLNIDAPVVASAVDVSSMRQTIAGPNGQFLEPPFLIRTADVEMAEAFDWQTFFRKNVHRIAVGPKLAVAEFNSSDEFRSYQEYMRKNF